LAHDLLFDKFRVEGRGPRQPLGKNHLHPTPIIEEVGPVDYGPAAMTQNALVQSMRKYETTVRHYTEDQLEFMFQYGMHRIVPYWRGTEMTSYEDACKNCNPHTSPGLDCPGCATKADAFQKYSVELEADVHSMLSGQLVPQYFKGSLKTELRPSEKVEMEHTRMFMCGPLRHLLASTMLFRSQNKALEEAIGTHPLTLGITVPGPQFTNAITSLGEFKDCYDADGSAYDISFNVGIARVICALRCSVLKSRSHRKCARNLYRQVYCGVVLVNGVYYLIRGNKSGWFLTGADNGLQLWLAIAEAVHTLYGVDMESVLRLLINGDDLAYSTCCGLTVTKLQAYLAQYGIHISFDRSEARSPFGIVFLSHQLRPRYVPHLKATFMVAAGNRSKLRASMAYYKTSEFLTHAESLMFHLVGIRICLWPWPLDFEEITEYIDQLCVQLRRTGQFTESIRVIVGSMHTEAAIARLHLQHESHAPGSAFFRSLARFSSGAQTELAGESSVT
jgi:hypothetical protein